MDSSLRWNDNAREKVTGLQLYTQLQQQGGVTKSGRLPERRESGVETNKNGSRGSRFMSQQKLMN